MEAIFPKSPGSPVHVPSARLDWSKFPIDDSQCTILGSFDIIVGADIIYKEEHVIYV